MILHDLQALEAAAAHGRPGRPGTATVHDTADARLLVFHIGPGQHVPPHTSPSTVILSVLQGSGFFSGKDGEQAVTAGTIATYEPRELHGMRAAASDFVVLATIAPRPGEHPASGVKV